MFKQICFLQVTIQIFILLVGITWKLMFGLTLSVSDSRDFFLVYFDLYVTEATHLYYLLFKLFVTKLLHCCFTLITVNPMVRWCFSSYLVLLVQIFIFDTWFAIFPIQNTIYMSFSFCASLYFIGFSTSWGNQCWILF